MELLRLINCLLPPTHPASPRADGTVDRAGRAKLESDLYLCSSCSSCENMSSGHPCPSLLSRPSLPVSNVPTQPYPFLPKSTSSLSSRRHGPRGSVFPFFHLIHDKSRGKRYFPALQLRGEARRSRVPGPAWRGRRAGLADLSGTEAMLPQGGVASWDSAHTARLCSWLCAYNLGPGAG